MNIAITTFFQSQTNYGQLLQAFAMQQILMELGYYAYTVRYGFHEQFKPVFANEKTSSDFSRLLCNQNNISAGVGTEADRCFDKFRRDHLNLSDSAYNTLDELKKFPPAADYYLTGSDQVWAQLLSQRNNAVFFLKFGKKSVRRLAYAPSFSLKSYPNELNPLLKKHLKRFYAISTREKAGIEICRKVGYKAEWVVDPTMLLDGPYYRRLAAESGTVLPENYAFVYHVNIEKQDLPCWPQFRTYNLKAGIGNIAVHANGEGKDKDVVEFLSSDAAYMYPTIQDWIRLIDGSRYVLTTSFHGMVFAILLHKPFFVSLRPESMFAGNDRVTDILGELELTDHIVTSSTDVEAKLRQPIDWDAVDSKLDVLRKHSMAYLEHALSGKKRHWWNLFFN